MMLAIAEIRRARGRFISIITALSLITFLVLTLSALSDGLFYGSTGAIKSTNANAYAFSTDAQGSLVRSQLPVADVAKFSQVSGVQQASPVGVLLTSATAPVDAVYVLYPAPYAMYATSPAHNISVIGVIVVVMVVNDSLSKRRAWLL